MRSPDACWVSKERWAMLSPEQKQKFPPVVPDFVVEICSESDELQSLQDKMEEWIENGVRLGWLLDVKNEKVYIYQPDEKTVVTEGFNRQITGALVMPGFVFDLSRLKKP